MDDDDDDDDDDDYLSTQRDDCFPLFSSLSVSATTAREHSEMMMVLAACPLPSRPPFLLVLSSPSPSIMTAVGAVGE